MLRMLFSTTHHTARSHLVMAFQQSLPRRSSRSHATADSYSTTTATAWQASPPGRPKIVIITGPTAVGKSKLGLELAKRLGGEIISADSVQVYKGLDIGSDKLPLDQRQGIPHHLIDILPPDAEFSAGDFHHLGRKAAEDIIARGKVPIVVGGTGFYLRWFIFGKAQTPPSNPETAAKLQQLLQQAWTTAAAAAEGEKTDIGMAEQGYGQEQQQQQIGALQQVEHTRNAPEPDGLQQQQTVGPWQVEQQQKQQQALNDRKPGGQQQQQQQQQQQEEQQQRHLAVRQQGQPPGSGHLSSSQQQQQQLDQALPEAAPALTAFNNIPPAATAAGLSEEQQWNVAVDLVAQLGDPETAERIRAERNNWYRLQRVLQILLQNGGVPLSEMDIDTTKPLDHDFRCFFLHRNRIELYDRICYRVEEMVASGLLQEALMLLDMGMLPNSHIATKAIGYRQACEFLQTALKEGHATKQHLQQMILDVATASRNLVKNQTSWFRDDDLFRWLEVGGCDTEDVVLELLSQLNRPQHEGGCGDSGRLDKELQQALKRYVPNLKIFNDDAKCLEVLAWVSQTVASRRQGQQQE